MRIPERLKPLCVILLIVFVMAFASTGLAQTKKRIVHLHDVSHGAPWLNWLRDAKSRFEALHPDIEIEFMAHGRDVLTEKMILLWGTGEHPDVMEVLPTDHYRFAMEGMFRDLNSYMAAETEVSWDQFFPVALEAATIIEGHPGAGSRWMLPVSLWVTGAAINDSQFFEAGLVPPSQQAHQWDWDEFADAAKKLTRHTEDGTITTYGAKLGTFVYWIHNAGGSIFDRPLDPTRATVNTEPVIRALDFVVDALHHSRYAMRGPDIGDFLAGRTAIFLHGGPNASTHLRGSGVNWEWSYALNPRDVRGGAENVTLGLALSGQSEHPDAAWLWMKFLATEAAAAHVQFTGRPVGWGPVASRFVELVAGGTEREQLWIELISHPDSYNRLVVSADVMRVWESYLQQVLDGSTAPAVAMAAAQQHLDGLLATHRMNQ